MCIKYKCPECETEGIGPHKSTNTLSNLSITFRPSQVLGMGKCDCFPSIQ